MRPRRLHTWLLMLVALALPASAQDPVEYLLEGQDQKRGTFEGRFELTTGPDGVAVRRRATFRDGTELLTGTGKRQGKLLHVDLPVGTGLSGALTPNAPAQAPVHVETTFAAHDATLRSTLTRGTAPYARESGTRIETPFGTGQPDPAKRPAPEPNHAYGRVVGVAFIKGAGDKDAVDINDVRQGQLGDCYFMAGLAAVARTQPERIRAMIEDRGDGTFTVYAWRHDDQWNDDGDASKRTAVSVRVDDSFPVSGSEPSYANVTGDTEVVNGVTHQELWPMLFEKAFAQFKGSYPAIEAGWASTPMSFFGAGDVEDETPADLTPAKLLAMLKQADKDGRPVALGVPKTNSALGIHGEHYYAFWGFDAQGRVLLYNPWGDSHPPRGLTIEEIRANIDTIHIGPK